MTDPDAPLFKSAESDPPFPPPSDANAQVFRYTDFTKFMDLLERRKLFFSRADLMGDPFEGSVSPATVDARSKRFPGGTHAHDIAEWNQGLYREWTFINCWHMNEDESDAMWKVYAGSNASIAIQSTCASLRAALPGNVNAEPCVYLGVVEYHDFSQPMSERNLHWAFLRKRRCFKHEHEIRGIIMDLTGATGHKGRQTNPGLLVDVNLSELIHKLIVAPGSPDWFLALVRAVLKRYGLDKPVEKSALDTPPVF
jgi:hypothetical protein